MTGCRALRRDKVEGVPWPGGITWRPLRWALGLRAAAEAGDGLAQLEAAAGQRDAALAALRVAVAREPRLRDEAAAEPDLAPLLDAL